MLQRSCNNKRNHSKSCCVAFLNHWWTASITHQTTLLLTFSVSRGWCLRSCVWETDTLACIINVWMIFTLIASFKWMSAFHKTRWFISIESESTVADTPHKRMLHWLLFNEALQQHRFLISYKLLLNMVERILTCFRQQLIQIMNLQRQDKSQDTASSFDTLISPLLLFCQWENTPSLSPSFLSPHIQLPPSYEAELSSI